MRLSIAFLSLVLASSSSSWPSSMAFHVPFRGSKATSSLSTAFTLIEQDPLSSAEQGNNAGSTPTYQPAQPRHVKMFDPLSATDQSATLTEGRPAQKQSRPPALKVFDPSNLAGTRTASSAEGARKGLKLYTKPDAKMSSTPTPTTTQLSPNPAAVASFSPSTMNSSTASSPSTGATTKRLTLYTKQSSSSSPKQPQTNAVRNTTTHFKRYTKSDSSTHNTQRQDHAASNTQNVAETVHASVEQMLKQQQDQLQRQQEQELKVKQDQVNHQLQQQQIQEQQRRLMLQQEEEERQRQLQQEQQIKQQQAQQPKKVNYFAIASEFDKISVSSWMNDPVFREKLNDSAQYFDLFDHPEAEWSSSEFIRKEHHRRKRERKRIGASVISGRARDASESETLLVGRTGEKKYVRYNPNSN